MRFKALALTMVFVLIAMVSKEGSAIAQEENMDRKHQLNDLILNLGYGGGIHNFKNYILRVEEKYRVKADESFSEAEKVIRELKNDKTLTEQEKGAVSLLASTLSGYRKYLKALAGLVKTFPTVQDIDKWVKVDDALAVKSLEFLRQGHEWTEFEELQYLLGYGGAIHHFKNYVLRGDDEYRINAEAKFNRAKQAVDELRKDMTLSNAEMKALNDIDIMIYNYLSMLGKIQEMISQGKAVKEIDSEVKVSDDMALVGLAILRQNKKLYS